VRRTAAAQRFLHTADWQIGRVFSQFEPDDAAALFEARFAVVERLARIATDQGVPEEVDSANPIAAGRALGAGLAVHCKQVPCSSCLALNVAANAYELVLPFR
jgi:hypothetical protein